jgi:hypothetical protein
MRINKTGGLNWQHDTPPKAMPNGVQSTQGTNQRDSLGLSGQQRLNTAVATIN